MNLFSKIFIYMSLAFILSGCGIFHTGEVSPRFHAPNNSVIVIQENPQKKCSSPIMRDKIALYLKQNLQKKFPNNRIDIVAWNLSPTNSNNFYQLMFTCNSHRTKHQGVMPMYSPATTTTTGYIGNTSFSGITTGGTTSYVNYNYTSHSKLISLDYTRWYKKNNKWTADQLWHGAVGDDISSFDKNPKKYIDLVMEKFGKDYQP